MNFDDNNPSGHFLNEARDFWWNNDFLQLMAHRLCFKNIQSILDVGCGQGHWGLLLLPLLHPNANLTGVEPEEKWRLQAKERAKTGRNIHIFHTT